MGEGINIVDFSVFGSMFGDKSNEIKRILVTRTDRIGDVVLSTPVLEGLRERFPEAYIAMLVKPYTADLVADNPYLDEVIIDDENGEHGGVKGFLRLAKLIRDRDFEVALILYSTFRVALLSLLSGIPQRIGPVPKPYSFFLYNRRVFQHRSRVEKHEADYNLDLAEELGIDRKGKKPFIGLLDEDRKLAQDFLKIRRKKKDVPLVILHPGMGRSAKNWKVGNYSRLMEQLIDGLGVEVFITGDESDREFIAEIANSVNQGVSTVVGELSLKKLVAVISEADLFIGPSTGPMHMAVAVGTPVITMFSPVKVQSARRWGPYNGGAVVLTPEVGCKAHYKCQARDCGYYDCMDLITPERVVREAKRLLRERVSGGLKLQGRDRR